jgi:hypothetical protein
MEEFGISFDDEILDEKFMKNFPNILFRQVTLPFHLINLPKGPK